MNSARKSPLVRASTRRPVPPVAAALSPISLQGDRKSRAQASAPPVVGEVLRTPGQPLDLATRVLMESRLGHQFSRVRVHTDERAAAAARFAGARAYTVGQHVVFDEGQYAPASTGGQQLLAHELTHVVQQQADTGVPPSGHFLALSGRTDAAEQEARRAAAALAQGRSPVRPTHRVGLTIQRDGADDDAARRWPGTAGGPMFQLRLDPEIEARLQASRYLDSLLAPGTVRAGLLRLDLDAVLGTPPPPWLTAPTIPSPAPLVPRGAGPSTPREANPGDVLRAVMRIPAVDSALTTLRTNATDRVSRDWGRLSTGERALVITQTAIIGGGALAGVLSSPEARGFALDVLQNRDLPVPGVPGLTFQFNATGPDQRIRFDLNVGALLPASWGFH